MISPHVLEQLYIRGTLVEHITPVKQDKRTSPGYKPSCVLLLPRSFNNNNDKCVNQNQTPCTPDLNVKTPKKINSGGVRKAILNKRQDDANTVKIKTKGRRKTIVSRKPLLKTPLRMTSSVFPNSSLGCTLEYYLTHFNMFRDLEDARTSISDYLRGGPEARRNEPRDQSSYRTIYGQLYGVHLDHVKKKVGGEMDKAGHTGMSKKTSLHIHQNCSCISHDVTNE